MFHSHSISNVVIPCRLIGFIKSVLRFSLVAVLFVQSQSFYGTSKVPLTIATHDIAAFLLLHFVNNTLKLPRTTKFSTGHSVEDKCIVEAETRGSVHLHDVLQSVLASLFLQHHPQLFYFLFVFLFHHYQLFYIPLFNSLCPLQYGCFYVLLQGVMALIDPLLLG